MCSLYFDGNLREIRIKSIKEHYNEITKTCGSQAPLGFEPRISCLLDRRFNQLSHGAAFCWVAFCRYFYTHNIPNMQFCLKNSTLGYCLFICDLYCKKSC